MPGFVWFSEKTGQSVFVTQVLSGAFVILEKPFKLLRSDGATAVPIHLKRSRSQMDSHPQRGSVMSRHRWMSRCLIASTTVLMVAVGGSAAIAQPIETTPAVPTPTQSAPAPAPAPSPDLMPLDAPAETTTTDPCAEPLTAPGATTTTTPPATSTTPVVPPLPCVSTVPAVPETSPAPTVTVAPETAPTSPTTDNPVSTSIEPSTPATLTPETAPSAPGEKEPWAEWTPTENPNATIVPGKMRSDR
ncbi:hypothetical protein L612_002700000450 [Rhodococcus rhodochrous J38]|nr:hypothetical protein L612_002700000450 [Rhodococcus rhodochrous J38]